MVLSCPLERRRLSQKRSKIDPLRNLWDDLGEHLNLRVESCVRLFGLDAQHARLQHESKIPFYLQSAATLEIDSGVLALYPLPIEVPMWVMGADRSVPVVSVRLADTSEAFHCRL